MTARLRCAIYTRKSSEEGLEQDFNSLHAQREACEAYIKSQVGEGWSALPTAYDDGGFSGGSMERPGLRCLLADIALGKVDVVVVYKVDRLTRSLADFAKIVEAFDGRGVSFVSVTQAFNTTTSMGRLTLNVLLSFAQFEREVTGERIRDKIAASKAKGMWMGGIPPLGYDIQDRKLVINQAEAAIVRRIFDRYLEVESAFELVSELERDGITSKAWISRAGKAMGGFALKRGAVFHILASRVYLGEIVHKDRVFPGQHPPIIALEQFEAAALRLKARAVARRTRATRSTKGVLAGKLFDHLGQPLSPTFSYGRGRQPYRYYVAVDLQTGRARQLGDGAVRRVSAPAVEGFLVDLLRRLSCDPGIQAPALSGLVSRVELRNAETHLVVDAASLLPGEHPDLVLGVIQRRMTSGEQAIWETAAADRVRIVLPHRLQLRGGAKGVHGAAASAGKQVNPGLVQALRRAHVNLAELNASPLTPSDGQKHATAPVTQHGRLMAHLAFLAPALQQKILEGSQPRAATLTSLTNGKAPLAWADQVAWIDRMRA
jgi:DNA invertase Pin-like site-specific DNA recombinase